MTFKTTADAHRHIWTWVCVALSLAWMHNWIQTQVLHAPTYHLDGAFQTASGLFRLAQGQMPGRDFMPYLGMGPLLLIYPFFEWRGGNLAASSYAAHLVCLLATVIYIAAVLRLWLGYSLRTALLAGFMLVGLLLMLPKVPGWAQWALMPGNSLRPLRAVLPAVVALIWYEIEVRQLPANARAVALGLVFGLCALWSNDFALITMLGLAVGVPLHEARKREGTSARFLLTFFGTGILTALITFTLGTAGQPNALLAYNFLDVAFDQWWYFGSYHPDNRVFHALDLLSIAEKAEFVQTLIFAAIIIYWYRQRDTSLDHFVWLLMALMGGGVVACVGGHIDNYFGGLHLCLKLTGWLTALHLLKQLMPELIRRGLRWLPMLLAACLSVWFWQKHATAAAALKASNDDMYVEELGGYLSRQWSPYIEYLRKRRNEPVFEEYWGIASAMNPARSFATGARVDAVIHALGQQRRAAALAVARAQEIVTTRSDLSEWQGWSVSQNYWLYGALHEAWQISFVSPRTIVWKRRAQADVHQAPLQSCQFDPIDNTIRLPQTMPGAYRVIFDLKVQAPSRRALVFFRNNFSYGGDAGGRVSLPPVDGRVDTLVLATRTRGESFALSSLPDQGGIQLKAANCRYKRLPNLPHEALATPWLPHVDLNAAFHPQPAATLVAAGITQ